MAYEWTGTLTEPARSRSVGGHTMDFRNIPGGNIEVQVRKPRTKSGHAGH
jgi:hypothetical protein